MAKKSNKITVGKCTLEFREGIAYLIEHKKNEDDVEFLLENLLEDFKGKDNLSFSLGTDIEI